MTKEPGHLVSLGSLIAQIGCGGQKGGAAIQETDRRPQGFISLPDLGSKLTLQYEFKQSQGMSEKGRAIQIREKSKVRKAHK